MEEEQQDERSSY